MPDEHPSTAQRSSRSTRQPGSFVRISGALFALALALGDLTACANQPAQTPVPLRCPTTVKATVSPSKPTVHVSYSEPSVNGKGAPLKTLAKTTIYYDRGDGRVRAKEVPASKPTGGGAVTQTVTIPVAGPKEQTVFICVTATDTAGHESPTVP